MFFLRYVMLLMLIATSNELWGATRTRDSTRVGTGVGAGVGTAGSTVAGVRGATQSGIGVAGVRTAAASADVTAAGATAIERERTAAEQARQEAATGRTTVRTEAPTVQPGTGQSIAERAAAARAAAAREAAAREAAAREATERAAAEQARLERERIAAEQAAAREAAAAARTAAEQAAAEQRLRDAEAAAREAAAREAARLERERIAAEQAERDRLAEQERQRQQLGLGGNGNAGAGGPPRPPYPPAPSIRSGDVNTEYWYNAGLKTSSHSSAGVSSSRRSINWNDINKFIKQLETADNGRAEKAKWLRYVNPWTLDQLTSPYLKKKDPIAIFAEIDRLYDETQRTLSPENRQLMAQRTVVENAWLVFIKTGNPNAFLTSLTTQPHTQRFLDPAARDFKTKFNNSIRDGILPLQCDTDMMLTTDRFGGENAKKTLLEMLRRP